MKYLLILALLYLVNGGIVSRNERIEGMIQKIKTADAVYDELISKAEGKIESELDVCELTVR